MEKVESFELDHRKVKAPYVRKCCVLEGAKGDKVTKFDLRFLQPNKEAFGTAAMHGLEHILAHELRTRLDGIIDFSPMGCRTGFYFLTTGMTHAQALSLTKDALAFIESFEGEVPGVSAVECGNYRDHDLEGAKKEAADQKEILKNWTTADMIY